jgi:outer membrane protein with glycine zipper
MLHKKLSLPALALIAGAFACTGDNQSQAAQDTTARDLTLAPAESVSLSGGDAPAVASPVPAAPAPRSAPPVSRPRNTNPVPTRPAAPTTVSLATGTEFGLTLRDSISSRRNRAGESFLATTPADVKNSEGRVVIPAGAEVQGTIVEIKPAPNPNEQGTLTLAISSVTVRGQSYPLKADIVAAATQRQGRGIEGADVARTGAGAAAGAIVGRLLGKNSRGAVIGGIVGGAAGAATSAAVKDSDIVLPAGANLTIRLTEALAVRL